MRLLLAACPTVLEVLECDDAAEAMAKIATYGVPTDADGTPQMSYPRAFVQDTEIHLSTDTMGNLLGVDLRTLHVTLAFYVPEHEDIDDVNDEHAWVLEQFSKINDECLALTGRGVSIAGHTHLCVENPIFYGVEREPDDERGDDRTDPHPELPRWFGIFCYEVH